MKADRTGLTRDKLRGTTGANGRTYGADYCACGCGTPKAARTSGMRVVTILKAMAFLLLGVMLARGIFG